MFIPDGEEPDRREIDEEDNSTMIGVMMIGMAILVVLVVGGILIYQCTKSPKNSAKIKKSDTRKRSTLWRKPVNESQDSSSRVKETSFLTKAKDYIVDNPITSAVAGVAATALTCFGVYQALPEKVQDKFTGGSSHSGNGWEFPSWINPVSVIGTAVTGALAAAWKWDLFSKGDGSGGPTGHTPFSGQRNLPPPGRPHPALHASQIRQQQGAVGQNGLAWKCRNPDCELEVEMHQDQDVCVVCFWSRAPPGPRAIGANEWSCQKCRVVNPARGKSRMMKPYKGNQVEICYQCWYLRDTQTKWHQRPAANEWNCAVCTMTNPASTSTCGACSLPRGADPGTIEGKWQCPQCMLVNDDSSQACSACEYAKPAPPAPAQAAQEHGWQCLNCTLLNQATVSVCGACNQARSDALVAPAAGQPTGTLQLLRRSGWQAPNRGHPAFRNSQYPGNERDWRQGSPNDIPPTFPLGCGLNSAMEELGQLTMSREIESRRCPPDSHGFVYRDLISDTQTSRQDKMRSQQARLLFKLVSDYVQGVSKPGALGAEGFGVTMRSIAMLLAAAFPNELPLIYQVGHEQIGERQEGSDHKTFLNSFLLLLNFRGQGGVAVVSYQSVFSCQVCRYVSPARRQEAHSVMITLDLVQADSVLIRTLLFNMFNGQRTQRCDDGHCARENVRNSNGVVKVRGINVQYNANYLYDDIRQGEYLVMQVGRRAPHQKRTDRITGFTADHLNNGWRIGLGGDRVEYTFRLLSFAVTDASSHYKSVARCSDGRWCLFDDHHTADNHPQAGRPEGLTDANVLEKLESAYTMIWRVEAVHP